MKATLLLAGPSLARLAELPAADVTVGVKRAAIRWACDWAVLLDSPALATTGRAFAGKPMLLTRQAYRPKYTWMPGLDVETVAAYGLPSGWDQWASTGGLALTAFLGATRVDAYGADFGEGETTAEFDGFVPADADHSPRRWANERAAWDRLCAWLAGRGVEVRRLRS